THHHPDHIGLAGWFQSERGAALWMTRTAWLYARMLQLDAWTDPPAEAERFFIEAGYGEAMLARWRKRAALNFSVTVAPMPLGVRTVAEGEVLRLGGADWRVLYGHGHAPDHLVLVRATDGMTIAGDAVLPRITPNIGLYATEPDGDPLGDWMDACARLAIHLGDDQLILPGHGDPFTGARTRLRDIVAKHERGLDRLHAHLSEPRTVVDCFPALYRREITPALEGLATNETRSHLNRLLHAGRATRAKRPDGAWLWRAV
ncbi:MAG: MBL fold metallo-hydrolase, partial [Pseudomonadota bacterium]